MSTIVLIRPGCTDFDDQQRIQGLLDLPLNARGEQQVQQIFQDLVAVPLDVIYASPCEPARSTAAFLGARLGLPVKETEGLRNLNQGLWQGLHIDDVRRKHPKVFKQWQELPETICPPGGEMLDEAVDRVRKALEKPLKKKLNFAIVVSEPLASVIRCLVRECKLESLPPVAPLGERPLWEYLSTNGYAPPDHLSKVNRPAGNIQPGNVQSGNVQSGNVQSVTPQAYASSRSLQGPDRVEVSTRGGRPDEFSPET